jgi:2-iminobutanoate/2-iminopropanoate deaminase
LTKHITAIDLREGVPEPIGHYSHAVELDNGIVYISGQKAWKPGRGTAVDGDIIEQTGQVLNNVEAILTGIGLDLSDVTRIQICLANLEDYGAFEQVYAKRLGDHRPTRVTLAGFNLRGGALIELIVDAYRRTAPK